MFIYYSGSFDEHYALTRIFFSYFSNGFLNNLAAISIGNYSTQMALELHLKDALFFFPN